METKTLKYLNKIISDAHVSENRPRTEGNSNFLVVLDTGIETIFYLENGTSSFGRVDRRIQFRAQNNLRKLGWQYKTAIVGLANGSISWDLSRGGKLITIEGEISSEKKKFLGLEEGGV